MTPSSVGASRRGPFCHASRFVDVMTWSVSEDGRESAAYACVAGSLSFPPYPTTLEELKDKATLEASNQTMKTVLCIIVLASTVDLVVTQTPMLLLVVGL